VAFTWLSKLPSDSNDFELAFVEDLADLLYEIGEKEYAETHYEVAIMWLERARSILAARSPDEIGSDAEELRIAIIHTLVKALMKVPNETGMENARNMVKDLDSGPSDKLMVLLMKLNLFDMDSSTEPDDYCNVILRIIRIMHLTDSTIKTVLHHAHKLRSRNSHSAHVALQALLLERLADSDNAEWVEKILVTIIWNISTSTDKEGDKKQMRQILELLDKFSGNVGPLATHASQAVSILRWLKLMVVATPC
jgi:hypothetical protein